MLEIPFKEVPKCEIENTSGFYHVKIENEKDPSKNREHYFKNEMYRDHWSVIFTSGTQMELQGIDGTSNVSRRKHNYIATNTHIKIVANFPSIENERRFESLVIKREYVFGEEWLPDQRPNDVGNPIASKSVFLDMNGSLSPLIVQPYENVTITYIVRLIFPNTFSNPSCTFSMNGESVTATLNLSKADRQSANNRDVRSFLYSSYDSVIPCIGSQEIKIGSTIFTGKMNKISDRKTEVHFILEYNNRYTDSVTLDRFWIKSPIYGNINFSKPIVVESNSLLKLKFVIPYYID